MSAGMAVVAGVKAVGAIKSSRDAKKGAKEQQAADQANIERMKAENAETVKRTEEQQRLVEGKATAAAAGTGFGAGSSKDSYVEALTKTHAEDLDWLKEAGESNVELAGTDAANRYSAARRGASTNLIMGIGSAASSGAMSYSRFQHTGDWWS